MTVPVAGVTLGGRAGRAPCSGHVVEDQGQRVVQLAHRLVGELPILSPESLLRRTRTAE